ncbi:MAG: hypothetical protein ACI9IA_000936 [Enterobacterales bacterium]|jgi:hypothetical protein
MYLHKQNNIKQLFVLIISISTLTLFGENTPPKEVNGMILKEDAKVDLAYIRPGVNWKKYSSIYIRELKVSDEAIDATPNSSNRGRRHLRESWIIPEKDIQLMKEEFARKMIVSLEKSGMKVITDVTKVKTDTLIMLPEILDIYLNAPIEKSRESYARRGGLYTDGAGSMTIAATFADSESMQVIAYAVDNKYPTSFWSLNNRVSNIADMRRLFGYWAKNLSKALTKVKE